jgi:beta-galactosidase
VKEMDQTRLIVAASDHQKKSYNLIPDWCCINTYPGWYGGMLPGIGKTVADFSEEIGKRTALSEYGAGSNPQQHQEGPIKWLGGGKNGIAKSGIHPEEYQAAVHEFDYAQIVDNPHLWGSFLWVMFDFPAAPRHEGGSTGLNDKGMVTQDRKIKKDVYFFYQANWTDAPMVYIAARRMTPRTQASTEIKIYSNCSTVELKVNGRTMPKIQPDKVHVFRWADAALQLGENQIEATGTANGKAVDDHCTWVLQPGPTTAPAAR